MAVFIFGPISFIIFLSFYGISKLEVQSMYLLNHFDKKTEIHGRDEKDIDELGGTNGRRDVIVKFPELQKRKAEKTNLQNGMKIIKKRRIKKHIGSTEIKSIK